MVWAPIALGFRPQNLAAGWKEERWASGLGSGLKQTSIKPRDADLSSFHPAGANSDEPAGFTGSSFCLYLSYNHFL